MQSNREQRSHQGSLQNERESREPRAFAALLYPSDPFLNYLLHLILSVHRPVRGQLLHRVFISDFSRLATGSITIILDFRQRQHQRPVGTHSEPAMQREQRSAERKAERGEGERDCGVSFPGSLCVLLGLNLLCTSAGLVSIGVFSLSSWGNKIQRPHIVTHRVTSRSVISRRLIGSSAGAPY